MLSKFSSSVKEKLEKYLASSTFELELYNATSNSNSNQASTRGLYLIAEKSHQYEALLSIIARIRQRLISNQRKKWKRINKTLHLIEFLLKNGSFQFVLVFIDKFISLVKPYVNYEYYSSGTDRGFPVRECSRRILELSKNRQQLRTARKDSSKLKKRITGTGEKSGRTRRSKHRAGRKRYVIDEEAFYNNKKVTRKPKTAANGDKKEVVSLANQLGLDEDVIEQAKKLQAEKNRSKKKSKAELEQEREIEEVRKIIEGGGNFHNYIKEVDLLDDNIEENSAPTDKQPKSLAAPPTKQGVTATKPAQNAIVDNNQEFDLFDLTTPSTQTPTANGNNAQEGVLGMETTQPPQQPTTTVQYNDGFSDFQSPTAPKPTAPGYTPTEMGLIDLNSMTNNQ